MDRRLLVCLVLLAVLTKETASKATYYSFERESETADDNGNVITEIEESIYDSDKQKQPKTWREVVIGRSRKPSMVSDTIVDQQIKTNKIGVGLEENESPYRSWQRLISGPFGNTNSGRQRGFLARGRDVAPKLPTKDLDELQDGLSRLMHVKQGQYGNFFNHIDGRDKTTRRPEVAVAESTRHLIERMVRSK